MTFSVLPGSKPTLVANANFFTTFFCLMWVRCWVFGDVGLSLGLTKPNSAYYLMIAEFFVFFFSVDDDEVTRLLSLLLLF